MRKEGEKFKAILGYITNLRPAKVAWDTQSLLLAFSTDFLGFSVFPYKVDFSVEPKARPNKWQHRWYTRAVECGGSSSGTPWKEETQQFMFLWNWRLVEVGTPVDFKSVQSYMVKRKRKEKGERFPQVQLHYPAFENMSIYSLD